MFDPMEHCERARIFAALADPQRLAIYDLIAREGEVCGKQIAEHLSVSGALVSHHAKILEQASLIQRRRDGQHSRFSVCAQTLQEAAALTGNCTDPDA